MTTTKTSGYWADDGRSPRFLELWELLQLAAQRAESLRPVELDPDEPEAERLFVGHDLAIERTDDGQLLVSRVDVFHDPDPQVDLHELAAAGKPVDALAFVLRHQADALVQLVAEALQTIREQRHEEGREP